MVKCACFCGCKRSLSLNALHTLVVNGSLFRHTYNASDKGASKDIKTARIQLYPVLLIFLVVHVIFSCFFLGVYSSKVTLRNCNLLKIYVACFVQTGLQVLCYGIFLDLSI